MKMMLLNITLGMKNIFISKVFDQNLLMLVINY